MLTSPACGPSNQALPLEQTQGSEKLQCSQCLSRRTQQNLRWSLNIPHQGSLFTRKHLKHDRIMTTTVSLIVLSYEFQTLIMMNSRRLSGCLTARLQDSSLGGFRSVVSSHLNGFAEAGQFLNVQRWSSTKREERFSSKSTNLLAPPYCSYGAFSLL